MVAAGGCSRVHHATSYKARENGSSDPGSSRATGYAAVLASVVLAPAAASAGPGKEGHACAP